MKHACSWLYTIVVLALISNRVEGQQTQHFTGMEHDLVRAKAFIISNKNDSAILISQGLLDQLEPLKQTDLPFGLKVQLTYGAALEQIDNDTMALDVMLHVLQASEAIGQWETYAETCRNLANLYEKIQRVDQSIHHLRLAQAAIAKYGLDSIYPRFAVRIASWHRVFGNPDSSLFYANEVLRTAPKYGQTFEEAEGHLIIGLLYGRPSYEKALENFTAAARLYRKVHNYTSLCGILYNIADLHFAKDKFMESLAYTDSIFAIAPKIVAVGKDKVRILAGAYRLRGEIYVSLGRSTALHYIKKGYEMQMAYMQITNNERFIATDARYTDIKKNQQIEAQKQQIKSEKERRWLLLALVLAALLFSAVLAYYYRQLRQANRKTQEQSEQLKSLDAAKSRFFANVSHELRTPLTLLRGPVQILLKDKGLAEKQKQLLQMADKSGRQLEQLVNEILDLRKLEMGQMGLNEEPTLLHAFLRTYFAQFESLADRKQIAFSFELAVAPELTATIDREKFRQVLFNLLSNAFKFTPPSGRIEARVEEKDGLFQLSVADTGPGIHPDDLPHVFDRFFQTTRPDKPAEGGTGIGLALCREYAHLFGGDISVESRLGQGSVFQVTFPLTLTDSTEAAGYQDKTYPEAAQEDDNVAAIVADLAKTGNGGPNASKPTILVVEDNPDLQDYISLILSEKYEVITAEHGQAAMDWLTVDGRRWTEADRSPSTVNRQPSLILSDLMMPVMDGFQLLERLKSDDTTRHIPVIMLTARAEVRDKLKALRIGVDDYLLKPFDEEELLVRIENLLKNQSIRRQEASLEAENEADSPTMSHSDREWLEAFEAYVAKHLALDVLNVAGLAFEFAMSESTLLRQLKRLTGLTPNQYLQEVRLNEGRRLLEEERQYSVAQVASKVGYSDPRSFSRNFRQRFGKLPSDFNP